MMNKIKKLFSRHTILIIYLVVLIGLLYGCYVTSGDRHIHLILLYGFSLLLFYFGFAFVFSKSKLKFTKDRLSVNDFYLNGWIVLTIILFAVLCHYFLLGGVPVLIATQMYYVEDVALVRLFIAQDTPKWMAYITSFLIKAIFPFLLLYFHIKKERIFFWILFVIAVFYGMSLMQKSYVVSILLPIAVYMVFTKKYVLSVVSLLVIGLSILILVKISNPPGGNKGGVVNTDISLEEFSENSDLIQPLPLDSTKNSTAKPPNFLVGIFNRVFVVPGGVVSDWFDCIPEKVPFLYGDGYRIVAKLKGTDHKNYGKILYPIIKPHYAKRGLKGTVNAASFMYDYANFGVIGLILSGFILALVFSIIEILFKDFLVLKISLNLMPIFMLSSSALTTLLLSGGWFLLIFLFVLLLKKGEYLLQPPHSIN